jgi:Spy/CpxP family protein refolding chaperone
MKRLLVVITTTLFLLGSTLSAQPGMGMHGGKPGNPGVGFNGPRSGFGVNNMSRIDRMQTILQLTDEQKSKISDIRFEHQNFVLDTKNEIQKNRLTVRKMMADNNIDQKKLLSLTEKNSELNGKIKSSGVKMWLEVYNILNDTQKTQWTKMFGQFRQNNGFARAGKSGRTGKSGMSKRVPCNNRMPQRGMGMGF